MCLRGNPGEKGADPWSGFRPQEVQSLAVVNLDPQVQFSHLWKQIRQMYLGTSKSQLWDNVYIIR
jgi:hypothetical protein